VKINIELKSSNTKLLGYNTRYDLYDLSLAQDGTVLIKADFYVGVIRAFITLWQILINPDGPHAIHVVDEP
jgi:hypothetical protein